jgi:ABC-type glutathione transport system ATPase component
MADDEVRRFRMRHVSMVYQDPGAALNPTTKVGPQVIEAFTILGQSRQQAQASALKALQRVQIADPEQVSQRYPHQLSGGMQQRVAIARALAMEPHLLMLDEPTSALDPQMRGEVLAVLRALSGTCTLLVVTHEMSFARNVATRIWVFDEGKLVEDGPPAQVTENPRSERARAFFRSGT